MSAVTNMKIEKESVYSVFRNNTLDSILTSVDAMKGQKDARLQKVFKDLASDRQKQIGSMKLLKKIADSTNESDFNAFVNSGELGKVTIKLSEKELEMLKGGKNWWVRIGIAACSAVVTMSSALTGGAACIIGVIEAHDAGF